METPVKKILIVEDDTAHYELIQRSFERRSDEFVLKRASNLYDANKLLISFRPDLIISDWKLPDGNGTSLIQKDK
ncbi:MAG: response regulator, partial [Ignavibacteriaceae bacterium]|nr:response regulator [Ignavibacteriaceae bacterium]